MARAERGIAYAHQHQVAMQGSARIHIAGGNNIGGEGEGVDGQQGECRGRGGELGV